MTCAIVPISASVSSSVQCSSWTVPSFPKLSSIETILVFKYIKTQGIKVSYEVI